MAFTKQSLNILEENYRKNSREWYAEHKAEFRDLVEIPMLELAAALAPALLDIAPLIIVEPKRVVSKIWRDTRFSRDKSVFKRAVWLAFRQSRGMVDPVFFFEITPDFYRYGCDYYSAPPKVMALIRESVLRGDKLYREAAKALRALPGFTLEGECYKRPQYPDQPEEKREWLERKSVTAMITREDWDFVFSSRLADHLSDVFRTLAPFYRLLIRAHEAHFAAQEHAKLAGYEPFGGDRCSF